MFEKLNSKPRHDFKSSDEEEQTHNNIQDSNHNSKKLNWIPESKADLTLVIAPLPPPQQPVRRKSSIVSALVIKVQFLG